MSTPKIKLAGDSIRPYYDYVITTEEEFANIPSLSGRILVKGSNNYYSSTPWFTRACEINIAQCDITLIEFSGYFRMGACDFDNDGMRQNIVIRGRVSEHVEIRGGTFVIDYEDRPDDGMSMLGLHIRSVGRIDNVHVSLPNGLDGSMMEHVSIWFEACTNISNCDFSRLEDCTNISNCRFVSDAEDPAGYIVECYGITGISLYPGAFERSNQYIFTNCGNISNVEDTLGIIDDSCTNVDPDTCPGYVSSGGGSSDGGGKLYKHDVHLFCGEYWSGYSNIYTSFVSTSETPITTIAELNASAAISNHNMNCHYADLYLTDSMEGQRQVDEVRTFANSGGIHVTYITAYTVPPTMSGMGFTTDAITITDTVTEV